MVEAQRGATAGVEAMLDGLDTHVRGDKPVALAINKIDRVRRDRLLALAAGLNEKRDFTETFMISAIAGNRGGSGVADLRRWLAGRLPAGPWHYPEDQIVMSSS